MQELRAEIALLEKKQEDERFALNEQFKTSIQNLRPVNLIKNSLKDLFTSPDLKDNLVNSTLGIGAGILTKKIIGGANHHPIKNIVGTLLQLGVTNLVANHGEGIKLVAVKLFSRLFKNKSRTT